MKSNPLVWLACGLSLALLAGAPACASPVQIGIGGGANVPLNDAADALKTGWHVKGILNFTGGLPVDLGAAVAYSQNPLDAANTGYDGTGKILSGLGKVSLSLPFPGPLKPYVTAGLGAYRIDTDVNADGVPDPKPVTKFGIDGGAGVRFKLFGLKAFVEGTLENIYTDQGFNSSVIDNVNTQVVPVTFGVLL